MRRLPHLLVLLVTMSALVPNGSAAQDGFVGIYADAAATQPCTTVPPSAGAILYVVATLDGSSAAGITGAEFRVEVSHPTGWLFSFAPAQGVTAIGSPLDTDPADPNDGSGITLAFAACQPGASGQVLLGTIGAFNLNGSPTSLAVKRHSSPTNTGFSCPLFVLCDSPTYSKICMTPAGGSECTLGKTLGVASVEQSVFVAGLNQEAPVGGEGPGDPQPMPENLMVRKTVLVHDAGPADIVGLDGPSKPVALVATDTTWVADWTFDGSSGACNFAAAGWTAQDHLVRNTSPTYWRVNARHAGTGPIVNLAAELAVENCWATTGYGNRWDQAVRLRYKGTGSTLTFDFLSEGETDNQGIALDYMTVEADAAGASNDLVEYEGFGPWRRPEYFRQVLHSERDQPLQAGRIGPIPLPVFGDPGAEHIVWIRFHSDARGSDEDGDHDALYDAALVVDNVRIEGGDPAYDYFEDFEDGTFNPLIYVNSDRSKPLNPLAPSGWGRSFHHVRDNDQCTENTTCSIVFTDPGNPAIGGGMEFAGGIAVAPWTDNVVVSPWIPWSQNGLNRVLLAFREFPGNRFTQSWIARGWDVRGRYTRNGTVCTTAWSHDGTVIGKGTWEAIDGFTWTSRLYDMSEFVVPTWSHIQVRIRVADQRGLTGGPPLPEIEAPGPFIDRIRIGRMAGSVFVTPGPDPRTQAQDCFPTELVPGSPHERYQPSTDRFGTCAFSMSGDIGAAPTEYFPGDPTVIPGDSIATAWISRGAGGVTRIAFYYRIIAGPHAGKMAPLAQGYWDQIPASHGFFKQDLIIPEDPEGGNIIDFDDTYFRGGDVVQYFWYAQAGEDGPRASYPPGITNSHEPDNVLGEIETLLGGLLEVDFLPQIDWSPSYLARIAAHPTGDIDPTPEEIAQSSQRNCILYVNKVNTGRRSGVGNRTSFMYTLDNIGYRDHYDVYDLQGSGNVNNDLASRATVQQVSGYSLIVHDVGRARVATIPDGSNLHTHKVNQELLYRSYLANAGVGHAGRASLWVIGENWAYDSRQTQLVANEMGLANVEPAQQFWFNPTVAGQLNFAFADGPVGQFAGTSLQLASGCPAVRDYDEIGPNSGVATHRFKEGTVTGAPAVVMRANATADWNTIAMMFNWFDLANVGGQQSAARALATTILVGVLPTACEQDPIATDAPVEPTEPAGLPIATALHQNWPNPFNPMTTIRFDLANEARVRLRIFDVAGRVVRTIVDDVLPRQAHAVTWNGLDEQGARVANGLYVYRLEADGFVATRKLIVVK